MKTSLEQFFKSFKLLTKEPGYNLWILVCAICITSLLFLRFTN